MRNLRQNLLSRTHPQLQWLGFALLVLSCWAGIHKLYASGDIYAAADILDRNEWPKTDFTKRNIDFAEIFSGGPPKDGIPAVDTPRFIRHTDADRWLQNTEPVIALEIDGIARAYPLQIMIYHEIVNDRIRDVPISVTFCPLCNAAIVFKRQVGSKILDFGTTGRLRKSDLLMYDRQTQSWWQQFVGEAIVGHYTGIILEQLPAAVVSYQAFKQEYPEGMVLSRRTGYSRPYGKNPYQGYDTIGQKPFLYFDPLDPRLPPMERVIGITRRGGSKIYPLSIVTKQEIINDTFLEMPIVVIATGQMNSALNAASITASRLIPSARIFSASLNDRRLSFYMQGDQITDRETRSRWSISGKALAGPLKGQRLNAIDAGVHFAFAWLAFRPDAVIYSQTKR